MKLPHCEVAIVPRAKVVGYLLSAAHFHRRHKAAFFTRLGFSPDQWEVLAKSLKDHAADHDVAKVET